MSDTDIRETIDAIRKVVRALERRIRTQRAVEWAVSGLTATFLIASVALVLAKTGWIDVATFWWSIKLGVAIPVVVALWGWTRPLDAVSLAQRLDTVHTLHDRLSTALSLAEKEDLHPFELAQIRDAARYVGKVDPRPASPFQRPADLIPFIVVLGALAFVALLKTPDHRHPLPAPFVVTHDAVLDDATLALEKDRLEAIRAALKDVEDPEAEELLDDIERLLEKVENREISEKEFLEELERIEKDFFEKEGRDDHQQLADKLKEAAEQLEKDARKELEKAPEEAKDLVEAFKKKDFEKASKAMEELAKKLENDEFDAKDLERLAKLMEKFADLIDPEDPALQKLIEENQELIDKLSKLFDQGKLDQGEKERLDKAKKKQDSLKSEKKKRDNQPASRSLKELKRKTKEMADQAKKAAEEKKSKKGAPKDPNQPDFEQEAGRSAKDAARQLEKESKEGKKSQARQMAKKQLDEMREAMRRSSPRSGESKDGEGEDGKKGEQMKEFLERAKGQKPGEEGKEGQEGKEGKEAQKGGKDGEQKAGEGQGKGESGEENEAKYSGDKDSVRKARDGGKGDAQEADFAGKGEGGRELGEETKLDSKRQDSKVEGKDSGEGASSAEVIKTASEEGFANTAYRDVYVDYESVVEEVMEKEKIPAGYRYYIKRYFQLIKPQEED